MSRPVKCLIALVPATALALLWRTTLNSRHTDPLYLTALLCAALSAMSAALTWFVVSELRPWEREPDDGRY